MGMHAWMEAVRILKRQKDENDRHHIPAAALQLVKGTGFACDQGGGMRLGAREVL